MASSEPPRSEPPDFVAPMRAVPGPVPTGRDWAAEVKWDGIRLVTAVGAEGVVRCWTRSRREVGRTWPEVSARAPEGLRGRTAVLDGEIVALGPDGRPSFGLLQRRMGLSAPADVARTALDVPVGYLVFDVLLLDGRPTTGLSWQDRRDALEQLDLAPWQVPAASPDVTGLLAFTREQGLEGIVAKRRSTPYRAGARSPDWVKVKNVRTQEVVVGGWLPGQAGRTGDLGALLLGIPDVPGPEAGADPDAPPRLRFVGRVGTGWTAPVRRHLLGRLRELAADRSPFTGPVGALAAIWVEPVLVGEVSFGEVTAAGILRHPSWRGLRPDKTPAEVVDEAVDSS